MTNQTALMGRFLHDFKEKFMLDFILSLVSQFFNRKNKLNDLSDALDSYLSNKSSIAAQLRLEAAFSQVFRKQASSTLIERLAKLESGPLEALTIFGRSSPAVRCNFKTHEMTVANWLRSGSVTRSLVVMAFVLFTIATGVTFIFVGTYVLYSIWGTLYFTEFRSIFDRGVEGFVNIFSLSCIGVALTIFGCFFSYLGWDIASSLESDNKALKLYEELSSDS